MQEETSKVSSTNIDDHSQLTTLEKQPNITKAETSDNDQLNAQEISTDDHSNEKEMSSETKASESDASECRPPSKRAKLDETETS